MESETGMKRMGQAVRYARSEASLRAGGGRRLVVRLSGESVAALESLKARHGLSTQKEVVELALANLKAQAAR
jgi:hypothetical protein